MCSKGQLAHMIFVCYLLIKHITQLIFILIRILHSLYWLFHCWGKRSGHLDKQFYWIQYRKIICKLYSKLWRHFYYILHYR